ncbi:MAG: hypothetical protein IPL26_23760 [Leptospiraceae bacterium]|nr:hypothetical protein [Leptospiraceae bacterium]
MAIAKLKIQGNILIRFYSLEQVKIEDFCKAVELMDWKILNSPSYKFIYYYLKRKSHTSNYPVFLKEDISLLEKDKNYQERFFRLSRLALENYYFITEQTSSDLKQIIQYSREEKASRCVIFSSSNLIEDFQKVIKVFKMNSFLFLREANLSLAQNLFNPFGFIKKKTVTAIMEAKAKHVNDSTFKVIELLQDVDFESNLTVIRHISQKNNEPSYPLATDEEKQLM